MLSFTVVRPPCTSATITTPSTGISYLTYTIADNQIKTYFPNITTNYDHCPLTHTLYGVSGGTHVIVSNAPYSSLMTYNSIENSLTIYTTDVNLQGTYHLELQAYNTGPLLSTSIAFDLVVSVNPCFYATITAPSVSLNILYTLDVSGSLT